MDLSNFFPKYLLFVDCCIQYCCMIFLYKLHTQTLTLHTHPYKHTHANPRHILILLRFLLLVYVISSKIR